MKPDLFLKCFFMAVVPALSVTASLGQTYSVITGIEHFTTQQGLADNTVNALLTDGQGSLWIGTENGLNQYLNTDFERFNEQTASSSLAGHSVSTLFRDSRGWVWVGDRFLGLSCYNPLTDQWRRFHNQSGQQPRFEGKEVVDIVEDKKGDIWFAAFPDFLIRYSPGNDSFYHHKLYISNVFQGIHSLNILDDRHLIVNTGQQGLLLFDISSGTSESFTDFYSSLGSRRFSAIHRITTDKKGNLLLMQDGEILLKRGPGSRFSLLATYPKGERPVCTFTDDGSFFVAASSELLHFDENYRLKSRSRIERLKAVKRKMPAIRSLCCDRQGVIWLGTADGLFKIDPGKQVFKSLANAVMTVPLEEGEEELRSLFTDRQGNVWVGPRFGNAILRLRRDDSLEQIISDEFSFENEQQKHTINCLLEMWDGRMIAAGYSGVFIHQGGKFRVLQNEGKVPYGTNNAWSLLQLDHQTLLMGTKELGLFRLDLKTGKTRPAPLITSDGKPYTDVFATWNILKDKRGRLWLATSKGLFRATLLPGGSVMLQPCLSLPDCSVWALCETKNGTIWLGTIEYGVFCITPSGQLQRQEELNAALPSYTIRGIVEDADGQLWISTTSCISRVRFQGESFSVRNFDVQDGLPVEGFISKAAVVGTNGTLFFASKNGLLYFQPGQVNTSGKQAHLLIRNCAVSDKSYPVPGPEQPTLVVSAGNSAFSIEPALTDYANPEKNRFYYLLEGVDQNWRKASGKHPFIQYAGLLPGKYRLLIRAENPDGLPALNELVVPVVVEARFWQETWFRAGVLVLALILLMYMTYLTLNRMRLRRKLARSEIASLRLQMNPHFVFNSLNSIQDLIYHDEKELAGTYLTRVARLIRLIMENSVKTAVSLDEEIRFLKLYLELEALRFSSRLAYSVETDPDIDTGEYTIPPMILQPLVENALKHAMGGSSRPLELRLLFEKRGGDLCCSIIDNGVGFQPENTTRKGEHQSMGLQVVKERLDLLNRLEGKQYLLTIRPGERYFPGKGTEILIYL